MSKTVETALDLLQAFTKENPEWGVRELANHLGMHHANSHRLLQSLTKKGFLQQTQSGGKYRLGIQLYRMGMLARDYLNLEEELRLQMKALALLTQETVFLSLLDGNQALCVQCVESKQVIKFSTAVGFRTPLYAGSYTKVMLAYQDKAFIESICAQPLVKLATNSILEPIQLQNDLAIIRQQGWCFSQNEAQQDTWGLAVPIQTKMDKVGASLSIAGPTFRLDQTQILSFMPQLQHYALIIKPIIDELYSQA